MYLTEILYKSVRKWNHGRLARKHNRISNKYPYTLGVLAIMKDEGQTIDEWIAHYLQVGADIIYLIDNGSSDNTVELAQVWVEKGFVKIVKCPRPHRQLFHYWHAIKKFKIRESCKWLLISDLDEFWFCPDGKTLKNKLNEFDFFSVIYANWSLFGSSGLHQQPQSVRRSFIKRDPNLHNNLETKYIVRTSEIRKRTQIKVHKFRGANSERTISDNKNFALFHYRIQSREYFERVKKQRGDALFRQEDLKAHNIRNDAYFQEFDRQCTQTDRRLADLVERSWLDYDHSKYR